MIAIIDYDAGNIKSVEKALLSLGQEVTVTAKQDEILGADKIVLPGVGAFGDAMENLRKRQLDAVIREAVEKEIPFLGICLGLQVLFEQSEEAPGVEGLGILKGKCTYPCVGRTKKCFCVSVSSGKEQYGGTSDIEKFRGIIRGECDVNKENYSLSGCKRRTGRKRSQLCRFERCRRPGGDREGI